MQSDQHFCYLLIGSILSKLATNKFFNFLSRLVGDPKDRFSQRGPYIDYKKMKKHDIVKLPFQYSGTRSHAGAKTGYSDGADERISGFLDTSDQQSSLPYTIIDEGRPACECLCSEISEKNY